MQTTTRQLKALVDQVLQDRAFMMVYQPILSLKTKTVVGYEALCRPKLDPSEFCPNIETFVIGVTALGLQHQFDLAVTETVLRDIEACPLLHHDGHFVHINLCAESLHNLSFSKALEQLLLASPVAAGKIRFEITEAATPDGDSKDNNLVQLSLTGCQFVLGNFITGYSNFGTLITPFISTVKVDKSVTRQLNRNDIADKFMKSLITLLAAIDKKLIIEGVETSAQLEFLRANNADYVQGYYLAKPMVKELLAFANSGALLMLDEAHKVPTTRF